MSTQTEVYGNPGIQIDTKVKRICAEKGLDYAEGLRAVRKQEPDLWRAYAFDETPLDREVRKGAEEFDEYVRNYQSEFGLSRREAERQVGQHVPKVRAYAQDPAIKIYSQGGQIVMNTEKVPLSAESVVAARTEERMAKGVKDYGEAMRAVLADDPHLAVCYQRNLPYTEAARKYVEDPMRSQETRALVEPRPDAILTPSPDRPAPEFTNTARLRLGALLAGAKGPDGGIDIPLAVQIAGLVPNEVRAAAGEALDELTRAMINRRGMPGIASEAYPVAYRLAVAEHPELWAASETGTLSEKGLKDLFLQWFK